MLHDEPTILPTYSREAARREAAYMRALNPPPRRDVELPSLEKPSLPSDFGQRLEEIDNATFARGIEVDRERLLSLGKERFQDLLEADRTARQNRITFRDLSQWESVHRGFAAFGALEVTAVRRRKSSEIVAVIDKDRDKVRMIRDFIDLWKSTHEPATVRDVYRFRDVFESLVFGQSLLEEIGDDGRVHNPFFTYGAHGRKVALFREWIGALKGPLLSITVADSLTQVFGWLLQENLSPPVPQDFFSQRLPSEHQIQFTEALWSGFLFGYDGWQLWQYVGRRTRSAPNQNHLSTMRKELAKRFPAVATFHRDVSACFYCPTVSDGHGHYEFDRDRYRSFVDQVIREILDAISGVVAIAVDEAQGTLVARFQDWLMIEGKPKRILREKIGEYLAAAFPASRFQVGIEEVQP